MCVFVGVCTRLCVCVWWGRGGGGGENRNSENRKEMRNKGSGYLGHGKYRSDIHYREASLSQLASLTSVSSRCE